MGFCLCVCFVDWPSTLHLLPIHTGSKEFRVSMTEMYLYINGLIAVQGIGYSSICAAKVSTKSVILIFFVLFLLLVRH